MAEYKGIMVCGEISDGKLTAMTLELLGGGRKLADKLEEELSVVLMGGSLGDLHVKLLLRRIDDLIRELWYDLEYVPCQKPLLELEPI